MASNHFDAWIDRTAGQGYNTWRGGAWRSLVAHLNGVQEAAGSNPVAPTSITAIIWLAYSHNDL